MNRILNFALLNAAMPWLTAGALALCAFLGIVHCCRLYRRSKAKPRDPDEVTREMIRHENELMNHRLTWLLTAEGLLFTALGFALSKDNVTLAPKLIVVLAFVGVMLATSASIVLDAADAAIARLSPPIRDSKTDVIGYRGLPFIGVLSPWRVFPPMFICAWYLVSQI